MKLNIYFSFFFLLVMSCGQKNNNLVAVVYETSENGHKLTEISDFITVEDASTIRLYPKKKRQTITGFGGSFTESSAYLRLTRRELTQCQQMNEGDTIGCSSNPLTNSFPCFEFIYD